MKKDELLNKLRAHGLPDFPKLDLHIHAIQYEDARKQFEKTTEMVGGKVIVAKKTDDLNLLVKNLYPSAKVFASSLPYMTIAQINPDTVSNAAELNGVDVGIVQGEIAVAENGCIWVPQTMKERAVCFISEYLVILVDRSCIVNNMHEAYAQLRMPDYGFGVFISGPSKTADIEQALVMGAQAARGVTVIVLE